MLREIATATAAVLTLTATPTANAQSPPPAQSPSPAQSAPPANPPPAWTGPFGGTFNANFAVVTDYSYRGISQTYRNFAAQAGFGYETPAVSEKVPLSAYIQIWGSNVMFPGSGASAEIDTIGGLRYKALSDKLTFDLSVMRYNYPGADSNYFLDFNEFGLLVGYDFDIVQLTAGLHYSPNFFADSGIAWYKQLLATVPLPFVHINDNLSFKLFGSVGSQYVERNVNYGIPNHDYFDWQVGLTMSAFTIDFSIAYTATNISVQDCGNTQSCASRAIFSISKTF
jgi:uncharacterized protein (TIGR02001 family)